MVALISVTAEADSVAPVDSSWLRRVTRPALSLMSPELSCTWETSSFRLSTIRRRARPSWSRSDARRTSTAGRPERCVRRHAPAPADCLPCDRGWPRAGLLHQPSDAPGAARSRPSESHQPVVRPCGWAGQSRVPSHSAITASSDMTTPAPTCCSMLRWLCASISALSSVALAGRSACRS